MYEFDTIKRYIEMFDIDDYKSVIIISLFILLLSTRIFKAIHLSKEELIFINKKDQVSLISSTCYSFAPNRKLGSNDSLLSPMPPCSSDRTASSAYFLLMSQTAPTS